MDCEHIFGFLIFTAFENSETVGERERREQVVDYSITGCNILLLDIPKGFTPPP